MLVHSKEILKEAKAGHYAVLAPDFIDMDSARVFVRTAEELRRPVILSYAHVFEIGKMGLLSLEEAAAIGRICAERAKVPVVLHLDHGEDVSYVRRAVDTGFTSVMIDASMKPFEENIKETKEVVSYAHARGVTVEAEIGHVGQGAHYSDYEHTDSVYTTVAEASEFAERTGVDSLAVSIGTAHGIYKGLGKPTLNFDRLHEIAAAVSVPLVLHGGSGTGDDNIRRCASEGIAKLNLFTEFLLAAKAAVDKAKPESYLDLKKAANAGMKEVFLHYESLIEAE